jgi:RHS repeat-associated protein
MRNVIEYGNSARTTNRYDRLTCRLIHMRTTRASDGAALQDLTYAYDPVGNVTSIVDAAQETVYFNNQVVSASANYVCDAVYRLLGVEGREHAGAPDHPQTCYRDIPRIHQPLPGDGKAMRHYSENYRYDAVGNLLTVIHAAGNERWTRHYKYETIESTNRLSSTSVGQEEDHLAYDAHGNVTRMRHLPSMTWDFKDHLASTQSQVANNSQVETTYYSYDSGGQRIRKTTDTPAGNRRVERIYLAGFEIYREYTGDSVSLDRSTLHVMDDERCVALVDTRGTQTTIRYQLDNQLRSACVELDDEAAVISYEEYYPYGSTSYQAGRSIAEVSLKRYRFIGKERDDETGFYYHGARYCAPWLGRWTAPDPAGMADGTNIYAYLRNNPVRYSDSTGTVCDPLTSCIDPTEPTSREEAEQRSIPEEHKRSESPPPPPAAATPQGDMGGNQPCPGSCHRSPDRSNLALGQGFQPLTMEDLAQWVQTPAAAPPPEEPLPRCQPEF